MSETTATGVPAAPPVPTPNPSATHQPTVDSAEAQASGQEVVSGDVLGDVLGGLSDSLLGDDAAVAAAVDTQATDAVDGLDGLSELFGMDVALELADLPGDKLKKLSEAARKRSDKSADDARMETAQAFTEDLEAIRASGSGGLVTDEAWTALESRAARGEAAALLLDPKAREAVDGLVAAALRAHLAPLRAEVERAGQTAVMARLVTENPDLRDPTFMKDVTDLMASQPVFKGDVELAMQHVRGVRAVAYRREREAAEVARDAGRLSAWRSTGAGASGAAGGGAGVLPRAPGSFDELMSAEFQTALAGMSEADVAKMMGGSGSIF